MKSILDNKTVWIENLIEIANELNGLFAVSEKQRASLNQDANTIVENVKATAEKTLMVSRQLQSGKGLNLDLVEELYESILTSVDSTFSGMIASMNELVDQIGQILSLRTTLEEVSHSIKNVSLLMKVKSSKMAESEFDHVVVGLEGLSTQIKKNTEGINISAIGAKESILKLIDEMKSRTVNFKRAYSLSQNELKVLFDSIISIFGEIKLFISKIKQSGDQVESQLTELIFSSSYQSLFPEKLESIIERIKGLASQMGETEAASLNVEQWLISTQDITRSQKGAIEDVTQTTREASSQIEGWYLRIVNHMSDQLEAARQIDSSIEAVNEKVTTIDQIFSSISETLALSQEQTAMLLDSISNINKNVVEVSTQVSMIEVTRNDLEALTYNAVFKAAKVGVKGRVMGTITDEITSLSREVQAKISDKEAVIRSIVNSSTEFKGTVSDRLNRQLEFIKETNEKVTAETKRFSGECDQILAVTGLTRQLHEAILNTKNILKSDSEMDARFAKIRVRLQTIIDEMNFSLNEARETQPV